MAAGKQLGPDLMRYRDQLRLWESNYGRSLGWEVELDGRVVALLDEPHQEDMFWVSYRIRATTDDPELSARLQSVELWKGDGFTKLAFRSRALGLCAANPFPAGNPFVAPGRLCMRALYIGAPPPRPWDTVVLKLRAWLRGPARRARRALKR